MSSEVFLPPGTRLGAFALEAPLGRGGMGAVYRARNVLTGEARALKVILPAQVQDPDARARFIREMRIAAAIDHPNVVRVYEPALDGDTLLLPMELVAGLNLRQHASSPTGGARRLSPDEAIPLLVGICEGVAAVHAMGVIHRDLKPANVMVVRDGAGALLPKVLDFGAARRDDGSDGHTVAGIAIGTPQYMPPEQLRAARDLDARVDVYALGVIAYELLTGRRPYDGAAEEIMAKVFTRERFPLPSELVPAISVGLEGAILRALAWDRESRFESVRAFADALRVPTAAAGPIEDPRSSELVVERPTRISARRPHATIALGVAAAAVLFAAILLRNPPPTPAVYAPSTVRVAPPRPSLPMQIAQPPPVTAPPIAQPTLIATPETASAPCAARDETLRSRAPREQTPTSSQARDRATAEPSLRIRTTLAFAALFVVSHPAAAQDRRCAGNDPETAARERQRAREAYERATRRTGYVDPEALAQAIAAASASCVAGDPRGLLLRAAALHARADHVAAARDLDAYLALRPADREPDVAVRAFLQRLGAEIDGEIGRVRVSSPDARIERLRLGDTIAEDPSAWTPVNPGPLRVTVFASDHEDAQVDLDVTPGARIALRASAFATTEAGVIGVSLRRRAQVTASITPSRAHPFRPWAIATSVAAGGLLATGLGLLAWRESAASAYAELGCASMPVASATCVDRYGRFTDASGAAIGTLVAGGVVAAAAGVLWILDQRRPRQGAWSCTMDRGGRAVGCGSDAATSPGGIACGAARFAAH